MNARRGTIFVVAVALAAAGGAAHAAPDEGNGPIPAWVKTTFGYYTNGHISDAEIIGALEYLIAQDIIQVGVPTVHDGGAAHATPDEGNGPIPAWVKTTFGYYTNGYISDAEIIGALEYLIAQDIIQVGVPTAHDGGGAGGVPTGQGVGGAGGRNPDGTVPTAGGVPTGQGVGGAGEAPAAGTADATRDAARERADAAGERADAAGDARDELYDAAREAHDRFSEAYEVAGDAAADAYEAIKADIEFDARYASSVARASDNIEAAYAALFAGDMGAEVEAAGDKVDAAGDKVDAAVDAARSVRTDVIDAIDRAHRLSTDAATADMYEASAEFLGRAAEAEAATAEFLDAYAVLSDARAKELNDAAQAAADARAGFAFDFAEAADAFAEAADESVEAADAYELAAEAAADAAQAAARDR